MTSTSARFPASRARTSPYPDRTAGPEATGRAARQVPQRRSQENIPPYRDTSGFPVGQIRGRVDTRPLICPTGCQYPSVHIAGIHTRLRREFEFALQPYHFDSSHRGLAPMGSSNVPGTYRTMMFSSLHPHSRSVLTAPSRSALVTSGFHSETTMPNFISAAEGSGASKCERFLVAIVQIVLFSVRISPQVSLRIRHANANRLPLAPYSLFILSSTTEAAIGPVRTPR